MVSIVKKQPLDISCSDKSIFITKMKSFYLLLLFALLETSIGCSLDCSQVKCEQSFNPFDCPENTLYSNYAAICGCCPGCVRLRGT